MALGSFSVQAGAVECPALRPREVLVLIPRQGAAETRLAPGSCDSVVCGSGESLVF